MYRLVIAPTQKQDKHIVLMPEQQHYLRRVLRLKAQERFVVMDGRGQAWVAQLAETTAQILEPLEMDTELTIAVTLAIALPKGSGFEQIVRCCTELGVTALVPILSDRTLLQPSTNKLDRWRKIAQEAAEQSERQVVPTIAEPVPFSEAIELNPNSNRYLCVARREAPHLLGTLTNEQAEIVIATGPEGGWTEQEIEQAIAAGFEAVSLGRRVLRAITAPVMALSLAAAVAESERLGTGHGE